MKFIDISQEYQIVLDMHNKIRSNLYKQVKIDSLPLQSKKYSLTGWHSFPFLFIQIFPEVPMYYYRLISLSGVLYLDYLYTNELIIDEKISDPIVVVLSHLFLEKSLEILYEIFNIKSKFWKYFKKNFNEFSRAILLEKIKHKGILTNYSFNEFKLIAKGKAAMAKCAIAALGELSNKKKVLPFLFSFQDCYNISLQLVDDLEDWREDYLSGDYSYLLTNLIHKHGWVKDIMEGKKPDIELVGKALYFSGAANKNLELAIKYIERSLEYLKNLECPLLLSHVSGLKDGFIALWSDILCIKNKEIIKRESKDYNYFLITHRNYGKFKKTFDSVKIKTNISSAIRKAKVFLERKQSSEGFWSDFEIVKSKGKSPLQSNEWITGYVGYVLSNLNRSSSFLKKAMFWLIKNQHFCGGWGYNRDVPVDADSTFNCLLFLKEMNIKKDLIKSSIDMSIRFWNPDDGGFKTYIDVNSIRQYTGLSKNTDFSGWCSSHICVTALAVESLTKLGYKADSPIIKKSLDFLLSHQSKEGVWEAYWWEGVFYSTFHATKALLLNSYKYLHPFTKKTAQYLIEMQSPNGSWKSSSSQAEDPFSTALAIGTLLEIFGKSSDEIDKGIVWLLNNQLKDGSWISLPKLRIPSPNEKEPWKGEGKKENIPLYGSIYRDINRIFTTATVLLTLILYQKIVGNKVLCLVSSNKNNCESFKLL